jgi:4-amino-4-deoxy-L-arabinose transferase-like glycosyltransferase
MNRKSSRFIVTVVVAALVLRIIRIGSQSLWVDELFTLGKSIPKPGLTIWDYLKYNLQGPVHAFVIYCIHFLSTNDAWLRLPSAVAGAAAVYYLYRWAEVWLGTSVARWAAVVLAVHPLHIQYSQELRAYSFLVFFVTFAGYHFHRLVARETRNDTISYVLGIALAALSNFSAAFVYAVHSVLYVVRKGFSRRRLARWLLVSLAILVIISPWVYRIYVVIDVPKLFTPVKPGELSTEQRLRGETTFTPSAVPYLFYVYSVGTTLGPSTRELHTKTNLASVLREYWFWILWVGLVFGFLAVAGFWNLLRGERVRALQVALYIALPLLLLLAICWQNAKAFNVRYMLVAFPVYVCLVAAGVQALPGVWRKAVAALVFVTLSVSLQNFYFNPRYAKEDIRGAARYLEAHIADGDCVLVPTVTEVFQHYFKKPNLVSMVGAPLDTPRDVLENRLSRHLGGCRVVWYVRSREWDQDPQGELVLGLERMYRETGRINEWTGVEIRRYER